VEGYSRECARLRGEAILGPAPAAGKAAAAARDRGLLRGVVGLVDEKTRTCATQAVVAPGKQQRRKTMKNHVSTAETMRNEHEPTGRTNCLTLELNELDCRAVMDPMARREDVP
jgi:hypothetical protein